MQSAALKFERYVMSQDLSLGVMFAIIDSDADMYVSFAEFKSKLRQMDLRLDDEEILSFFKSLDINGNG